VRLIVKKEEAEFFYQSVRNSQTDIPVLTCAAARLEKQLSHCDRCAAAQGCAV